MENQSTSPSNSVHVENGLENKYIVENSHNSSNNTSQMAENDNYTHESEGQEGDGDHAHEEELDSPPSSVQESKRPNLLIQEYNPSLDDEELHDVSPIPLSQNIITGISDSLYQFDEDDEDEDDYISSTLGYAGSMGSLDSMNFVCGSMSSLGSMGSMGRFSQRMHGSTSSSDDEMSDEVLNSPMALEHALKKEHIVQDVQISNPRILSLLQEPENLLQLIKYVSEPHYIADPTVYSTKDYSEELLNKYFKYPYLAQQIFMVQHDEINPHIVQSDANLKQLFHYLKTLDSNKKLFNPLLPQIYTKTMTTLLKEFYTPIATFMMNQDNEDLLRSMILNIEMPEMHNLILKLLGYESQEESVIEVWRDMPFVDTSEPDKETEECKLHAKQWAIDNGFIKHTLEKLRMNLDNFNAHENLFNLLEVIIDTESVLTQEILSKEFMESILQLALGNTDSSLFEYTMGLLEYIFIQAEKSPSKCKVALVTVFEKTDSFVQLLDRCPSNVVHTPHGKLDPPLGNIRLLVIKHLAMIFESKIDATWIQRIDPTVLSKLVSLFFQYPFNNLLHYQCSRIFKSILESENDETILYLLTHAQLLKLIFATLKKEFDTPIISAVGYMGYLVNIGKSLPQAMESPQIDQYVKSFEEWKTFCDFLSEESRKQSISLGDSTF